jgi:hypothetical protein
MPKLIDADKLLEWMGDISIGFTDKFEQRLKAEIEVGTFDPTPVQPDTTKDKAIEMIGWLSNSGMPVNPMTARKLYEDAEHEMPDYLKDREIVPKEIAQKIDDSIREIIRGGKSDDQPTKEA